MKALKLMLAIAAPALLGAGVLPKTDNYRHTDEIQIQNPLSDDSGFRLPKQSYYQELFTKKELKKLNKAEKLRTQSTEALVLAAAIQKQADEIKMSEASSSKIQKQAAKLEAKAVSQELNALKLYEKAADIYRVVYTNELNNKTFSATTVAEKTAQNLALEAQNFYQASDSIKENITSENTLESYRAMYLRLDTAFHDQEIAFAIFKSDPKVDYTKYSGVNTKDSATEGNISKDAIPDLVASEHYDFAKDPNIYRLRYQTLSGKLPLSDDENKAVQKVAQDEANIATLLQKANTLGCTADTFRVYSGEATTLAEREYYEQKAQENELSECSSMVKAIKLEISVNNTLYELYKKYIPNLRNENNTKAKEYENQAEVLFNLSKSYETLAAKQLSLVEQYTQLSEGNEVKLQALHNIENAVALYLGEQVDEPIPSLATGACDRHNDIAMDFSMDESDDTPVVANNTTKPATTSDKKTVADSNTTNTNSKSTNSNNNSKTTTNNSNKTNTNTKDNTKTNTQSKTSTGGKTSTPTNSTKKEKAPITVASNAAVLSTSYYTRADQRMKPYSYPKGTIFSVETGIYKEMPEPVEFPSVEKFLAQNLKGQTYMRYYIGTFQTYDAAYAALAMAKNEGYTKSQVVAFVNGKKTDVNTARKNAEKTSGYQAKVQSELKALNANVNATTPITVSNGNSTGDAIPLASLGSTLYAVQISSLPKLLGKDAFNVSELYYDNNDAGLYRYYTGISNDINIANANLATLRQLGYDDAYIVKVVDGINKGGASANKNNNTPQSYPVYRVQIGAYKASLSAQSKQQIDKLKNAGYPVHNSKSGEYTVYTVGDCGSREEADKLRKELVAKGYKEAYVVVFVNGVKQ